MLGAVGQIALGPRALGMVNFPGAWVAIGWLLGGACLLAGIALATATAGAASGAAVAQHDPRGEQCGRGDGGRPRPRRRAGRLHRSPARPAVGLAVRLLAHGRGEPGGTAPRARRRRGDDCRRDGRGTRRFRRTGHLHPQRQLPRDRRARLGAVPRDVARRGGRSSSCRRAGHARPRLRGRRRSPRWRLSTLCWARRPTSDCHHTKPAGLRRRFRFAAALAWTALAGGFLGSVASLDRG